MLRRVGPLERLCAAVREVERLVLLGDVLELRHGPLREALTAAEPVLRALGEALPEGAEVLIVAGNHDHELLAPWLERRGMGAVPAPLGLSSEVDWQAGEPLALVAGCLAPARVRALYPGVWLRPDVYATHGHYGDLHTTVPMFERLGAGVMARIAGRRDGGPASAEDYEAVLGPMYAWIHALAQGAGVTVRGSSHAPSSRAWRALNGGGHTRRRRARAAAMRAGLLAGVAVLDRAGLGPLRADISGPELRRAGLRACAQVLERLDVRADWVLFGHTHRAGPLPGDERSEWLGPGGARLLNSGCWVHERSFLGASPATSPYRPGFAVRVAQDGEPAVVNLLDP